MKPSFEYNLGLLILRVGFSVFLLLHGIQKLEILYASDIIFADPIGLGPTVTLILVLLTEVLCSLLIIIGLKVRWAAIPPIILMLVAVFVVHKGTPIMARELAVLYLFAFSSIGILGGGEYSLSNYFS